MICYVIRERFQSLASKFLFLSEIDESPRGLNLDYMVGVAGERNQAGQFLVLYHDHDGQGRYHDGVKHHPDPAVVIPSQGLYQNPSLNLN